MTDAFIKFFQDHPILYNSDKPDLYYIMFNHRLCNVVNMRDALETIMITPYSNVADIGGGIGLPVYLSFKSEVNPKIDL